MSREFRKWLIAVSTPPVRAIGFVVGGAFSLLYGPFYRRHVADRQEQLEDEVKYQLVSLFRGHNARIIQNTEARNLHGLGASLVTVAVDGLLLRFIRWREVFQVHVASERLPNDWYELSEVLSVIDPIETIRPGAIGDFTDFTRSLGPNMVRLKEAFSPEQYPRLEKQMSEVRAFGRVVTRQWETEINRRLYPDGMNPSSDQRQPFNK
jgi:hypothetical protein